MPSSVDEPGSGLAGAAQVSHGLNLVLDLKSPSQMPVLLAQIAAVAEPTRRALDELHFVHFARFLPARGNASLQVITEFDGPLEPYVMDFVIAIGDIFDVILSFVTDAAHLLPVREHPTEFWNFVQRNNRVVVVPNELQWDDYPVYSAYPNRTVIDIVGPRPGPAPPARQPGPAAVDLADIQGNIVRGYRADLARHHAVTVRDAGAARRFLSALTDGDGVALPRVTTGEEWAPQNRPPYFLNIGVTAAGLAALGVAPSTVATLPEAFVQGPAAPNRAQANGDVGASAPQRWQLGGPGQPVHLLVSLYADADQSAEFERRAQQLALWWSDPGTAALQLLVQHDATALPDGRVHFGFRDGIAQPRIAGVHPDTGADMQPHASAGEFLLGANYQDVYGASSLGALPASLCQNATFAAVRVLEQDVGAFERLLDEAASTYQVSPELLAAKLMGRWRDGTPLAEVVAPSPNALPDSRRSRDNRFDYAPSHEHPGIDNDHTGLRCPVGAHIRRLNPRSALVAGVPHTRRIIRRGMPYGSPWDDGVGSPAPRGLYGIFICGDLERQFEFLMQVWANGDTATTGVRGTLDPIIGAQPDTGGEFRIPGSGPLGGITLRLPRLVTTRGSLYVMMPGISGLRFLANQTGGVAAGAPVYVPSMSPKQWLQSGPHGAATPALDPGRFDPRDPAFLADPYPTYALFRRHAPVVRVQHGDYASHWVFSHELVTQVCAQQDLYLKRPRGEAGERGLFFMDPPRHGTVRGILDPLFLNAMADSSANATKTAAAAIQEILAQGPTFELISSYASRVTRDVFMTMFGLPAAEWTSTGALIDTVLANVSALRPAAQRIPAALASTALLGYFYAKQQGCPARPGTSELLCRMQSDGQQQGMTSDEVRMTALHFALGGYLSTEFLVGTGIYNLLASPGAIARFRDGNANLRLAAIEEMKRFDAPFQMADRYAAQDVRLGGYDIAAGSMVTVVYGSANRDEAIFGADADNFVIDRQIPAGANYVFGHGIHYCIGAPMVSAVAPAVFAALVQAMPGLSLTGTMPRRVFDPYYRAFASLELSSGVVR